MVYIVYFRLRQALHGHIYRSGEDVNNELFSDAPIFMKFNLPVI